MSVQRPNSLRTGPDERGHFGNFGGRFVAETLMPLILDLEKAYTAAKADPSFQAEMDSYLTHYVGRPSPLYFAQRLTEHLGGAKIYLKREELNHTGAHKVNNVLGQIMVARRMGKKRIIAETGAGQHGVATATLCARFGLECVVYMGAVDVARQAPNVFRMEMLGAKVVPVQSGTRTLKDAMNEALRDWVTNVHSTYYCIGTVAGPHPYPMMVRDFQSVIGVETRAQMQETEGRLPDSLIACIGGGSNAMGLFHPFLDDPSVEIFGVEAAGHGLTQLHAASIAGGRPGVLHGNRTYLLMDADGQIQDAHSISAGLDYPGIGPEHSWLHEIGRVNYLSATDDEALAAFQLLSKLEGIIPALEPAHAIAKVMELAPKRTKDHLMVVNLSGRGDKDVPQVGDILRARASDHAYRHPFRRAEESRPRGLRHLRDGRRSRSGDLARDHQGAAESGRRRDRARHALHRSDGRRSVDPGGRPARAQGRHDAEEDARARARLPQGRQHDADRADGLLQPDLHLWRRQIPSRCEECWHRRPHHRRPAAGRGRRALPACDEGRPQLHSA